MAGNWRIRHKLMLGMALVMVVMALLLYGTLKGLFTFKATMRTFNGKLPERDKAEKLRASIQFLLNRPDDMGHLHSAVTERLRPARAALDDYSSQLDETVRAGWDPDQGFREKSLVLALQDHFDRLEQALKEAAVPIVEGPGSGRGDLLAEGHPVRREIDTLVRVANDLVNILNTEMSQRVDAARGEHRATVTVLLVSSITAVLLMAGLLLFFYRWVVRPLRILERGVAGVSRVATSAGASKSTRATKSRTSPTPSTS